MTIDKDKLKALAEAQEFKEWSIFFSGEAMRSKKKMFSLNGPSAVSCHENWGFTLEAAQFIAAANPATILALLAEIERYRNLYLQSEKTLDRVHCMYAKRLLDLTGEPQSVLIPDDEFVKYFEELKQLKAENEALRKQVADLSPFKNYVPQDYRATNKCLACGDYHHGLGSLPCPKCIPVAQSSVPKGFGND